MTVPSNILQAVQTYNPSELAIFENANVFVSNANTKFENFQDITANLGTSVGMELPYQFSAANGLVAVDQAITQRIHTMTVDQASNVSMAVTNPDRIFTLDKDDYMKKIGKSAAIALANQVEANVALNANSHVPVMIQDPADPRRWIPSGALHTESGPFRFYGDGVAALNSYQHFQQAIENFIEMGSPGGEFKMFIPNIEVPAIIGSGLNQFVPVRNEKTAQSWEIGDYGTPMVKYLKTNMLPVHTAGSVGNATSPNNVLTVVSVNDTTGSNVTVINCTTTVTSDSGAIKSGDLCYFTNATVKAVTNQGKVITSQPIQMRIIADAASTGSAISIQIIADNEGRGISWAAGPNQNCNIPIIAGMTIKVMPSHKCGLLTVDSGLFIAMPKLPSQEPFPSHAEYDEKTGVSMRLAYGALLGENTNRLVHDCIWGSTLVPKYCQRYLFPL